MNNKKGISAIVATVLIILITVAAVTIIWTAIIPMITNMLESVPGCLDAQDVRLVKGGFTCYDTTTTPGDPFISLQIARQSKDIDLEDVDILVNIGGNSETVKIVDTDSGDNVTDSSSKLITSASDLPGLNGKKVFRITKMNSAAPNIPDSIQIAPVLKVGGSSQTCDAQVSVTIRNC